MAAEHMSTKTPKRMKSTRDIVPKTEPLEEESD